MKRRREHASSANTEEICGRAFGHFPALIEKHHFIESALLRFVEVPDIIQPRCDFHACQRRCRMAAMFAKIQTRGLAIRRKVRAAEKQVHHGHGFIAAPVAHLIVDDVNARTAFFDMIRANDFGQMAADFFSLEGKRTMRSCRIFLQAFPVTFEREYLAVENMERCEQPPAVRRPAWPGEKRISSMGMSFVL